MEFAQSYTTYLELAEQLREYSLLAALKGAKLWPERIKLVEIAFLEACQHGDDEHARQLLNLYMATIAQELNEPFLKKHKNEGWMILIPGTKESEINATITKRHARTACELLAHVPVNKREETSYRGEPRTNEVRTLEEKTKPVLLNAIFAGWKNATTSEEAFEFIKPVLDYYWQFEESRKLPVSALRKVTNKIPERLLELAVACTKHDARGTAYPWRLSELCQQALVSFCRVWSDRELPRITQIMACFGNLSEKAGEQALSLGWPLEELDRATRELQEALQPESGSAYKGLLKDFPGARATTLFDLATFSIKLDVSLIHTLMDEAKKEVLRAKMKEFTKKWAKANPTITLHYVYTFENT